MAVLNDQSRTTGGSYGRSRKHVSLPAQTSAAVATPAPIFISSKKDIVIAFALALGYHLLILLLLGGRNSVDLLQFWIFLACDTLLWTLFTIPLISVVRRQLPWYDSIVLISMTVMGVTATFSFAFLLDPTYVRVFTAYESMELRYISEARYLSLVAGAELIMSGFLIIMLLINRRQVSITAIKPSDSESNAALLTGIFWLAIGSFGFVSFWATGSLARAMTSEMGSLGLKIPELGLGRYLLAVDIAVMCISLGMLGVLGSLTIMKRHTILPDLLILGSGFLASLPRLWNGARLDAVLAFVGVLVVAAYFGYLVRRTTLLIVGVLIGLIILWMTVVRGNDYVAESPSAVFQQLISGELTRTYSSQVGSVAAPTLAYDRIGALALVLEYVDITGDYLLGESLLSGPANIAVDLYSRFFGSQQDPTVVFRQANEVTFFWRYGRSGLGSALPPSLPGEFYMQFGAASVVILSILFAFLVSWFRTRLASSQSLIKRWILVMTMIILIKATSSEASVFFFPFVFTLLPVAATYAIIKMIFPPRRRGIYMAR